MSPPREYIENEFRIYLCYSWVIRLRGRGGALPPQGCLPAETERGTVFLGTGGVLRGSPPVSANPGGRSVRCLTRTRTVPTVRTTARVTLPMLVAVVFNDKQTNAIAGTLAIPRLTGPPFVHPSTSGRSCRPRAWLPQPHHGQGRGRVGAAVPEPLSGPRAAGGRVLLTVGPVSVETFVTDARGRSR